MHILFDPVSPLPGICPTNMLDHVQNDISIKFFILESFIVARNLKQMSVVAG